MAAKRKTAANKRSAKRAPKKASKKKTAKKKAAKKRAAPKKAAKKKAAKKKAAPKKAAKKKAAPKKKAGKKKAAKKTSRVDAIKQAAAKSSKKKKPKVRVVGSPSGKDSAPTSSRRNFGLRGAAPWVARHAAKHAEELRRRNAEPPPPGSARATLRTPKEAEQIKSKIAELHQRTSKIRSLRKKLDKNFFEIGELLAEVQRLELFEAKGFSTFESFLDREVDLPRKVSLRLIRISHTFQRETAYDFGLDRLATAIAALDGEITTAAPSHPSSRGWSSTGLPVKPPIRFDD